MDREAMFAHAFNVINGMGVLKLNKILKIFGSFESAWSAKMNHITEVVQDRELAELIGVKQAIDPEKEWQYLQSSGIKTLSISEKNYPSFLSEIPYPPAILYFFGEMIGADIPTIALVGTRRATRYGLEAATNLARDLALAGVAVVSGLALGIDSRAHRGALEGGGKTVAVLGSGLKYMYPLHNKGLAEEIIKSGGAVVSEFPPSYPPDRWTFPQRNRIIAGLSQAVVVVEAPQKSGALITANFALDYNREVGAVPGEISSINSCGTNALLKNGAAVIRSADDILELLGLESRSSQKLDQLVDADQYLLDLLEEPSNTDLILQKSGLNPAELNQKLTLLELAGKIKNVGGIFHKI